MYVYIYAYVCVCIIYLFIVGEERASVLVYYAKCQINEGLASEAWRIPPRHEQS